MLTEQEMAKIRKTLGRDGTVAEYAVFDALWSEHCSYKSSKRWFHLFNTKNERIALGIGEGAGLIDVGDGLLVGLGLESHNHPSAVDPFNGAATGVGGIVRDILSQGCKPIAILDCLRFGMPTSHRQKFLLDQVVLGISSYGNCIGVPNLGGDIEFSKEFETNPLVNAMCVGIVEKGKVIRSIAKNPGDLLFLFGSKTGLDGIGGVTFASEILEEEPNSEKRGSVQIGDPLTEKLLIDAVLELRDKQLISGLQDLGGGGLACAAAEMAEKGKTGVELDLNKVPLKVKGMKGWEILISESQERMLAVVPPEHIDEVQSVIEKYALANAIVGKVTDTGMFRAWHNDELIADIPVDFTVNGFPEPERTIGKLQTRKTFEKHVILDVRDVLLNLSSNPDLALKTGVFQQYDQHVQGNTIVSPGTGATSLMLPNGKSLVLAAGTNSYLVGLNPRVGTELATLEIVRKVWARKGEPLAMVDSLNFGNPEKTESYTEFVESIRGLGNLSHKLDIPVVGGNVSLYNETDSTKILPSPFVGIVGLNSGEPYRPIVEVGDVFYLIGSRHGHLYGSQLLRYYGIGEETPPQIDYAEEKRIGNFLISLDSIKSSYHIGRGGLLLTLSKILVTESVGITCEDNIDFTNLHFSFGEHAPRYLVGVSENNQRTFEKHLEMNNIQHLKLGVIGGSQIKAKGLAIQMGEIKERLSKPIMEALMI